MLMNGLLPLVSQPRVLGILGDLNLNMIMIIKVNFFFLNILWYNLIFFFLLLLVGGFAIDYDTSASSDKSFQFITIKGGRHEVPMTAPAQALEMVRRVLAGEKF